MHNRLKGIQARHNQQLNGLSFFLGNCNDLREQLSFLVGKRSEFLMMSNLRRTP
jgi:hypothetical protein